MTAPQQPVLAWAIKAPAIILAMCVLFTGCIDNNQQDFSKNTTVLDRVDTVGFGSGPCACFVSTTDGDSYGVRYYTDCALLKPGTNVTITGTLGRTCGVINASVRV